MRPIWNGTLAFGLVVIPVRLYAATERKSPSFNLLHEACHTPIKYLKWCSACEKEVSQDELIRAYQYQKGQYVTLSQDDLESIPGPSSHTIEILDFVNLSDVDPVYFEKSFFLEPREGAEKAYSLLVSSMGEEGKVAVAKVAIRSKETLALVRGYADRFIMMETMFWADEVREGAELAIPPVMELDEREKTMARTLVETLSSRFEPAKYENRQRQALSELIQKKVQGKEIVREPERVGAQVIDLMEALRKSVEEARVGRPSGPAPKSRPGRKKAVGQEPIHASPPQDGTMSHGGEPGASHDPASGTVPSDAKTLW